MKTIHKHSLLALLIFFACSCADDTPSRSEGTINFTSTHDCKISLFDDCENQVARTDYEVGKSPAIIYMKQTGLYYIFAESANQTKNDSLYYCGGNIEHYIEF